MPSEDIDIPVKRRPGRPALFPFRVYVPVAFTPEEKEALDTEAKFKDVSLSEYVRGIVVAARSAKAGGQKGNPTRTLDPALTAAIARFR